MRLLFLLSFLLLIISCSDSKKVQTPYSPFNGTWVPVAQELAGQQLPKGFYQKQKLIIADTSYTMVAESIDKGKVSFQGNQMDIWGTQGVNKGNHFKAIYKFEVNQLSICYDLSWKSYPENFNTNGKPGYFLSVFKKAR